MGISSRLARRLLIFVWAALLAGATGAKADPVKTLVQDTLYRADGSPGVGNITIRWSGFSTSAGEAVTAGEMTVATDANGGISIPLIPNTGSNPSGTYYRVMIKLSDGTISEEQWVVPVATSTTLAAIRAKVVPQAVAAQFVSLDYLNSALSKISTSIPAAQVNTDWNSASGASQLLNKPVLAAVASSGSYSDLSNTPAIPNLAAPGAIGSVTPGMINATGYEVGGTPLASSNLSDGGNLVMNTGSYANPAWLTGLDGGKITGALNNVPIGAITPNTINATNVIAQNVVTSQSPLVDIRAFGAVIDNSTPIDTALQAAITSAATTTGEVLLPCEAGCYLQNGSSITNPGNTSIMFRLQGTLRLGSTFVPPDRTDWVCDGGGVSAQFQMNGATCAITAPQAYGTMGTAISTTNSAVTFTPTFTGGSIANMPVNSAITIAGTTSCAITSITRTAASWNNVTATFASGCRIPAGTTVTVAGVTDSSFNFTPMITASDYPGQTLTWTEAGTASTSSGGTVTGFNEDSFESVRVTAVSGSTVTAAFAHTHSASDVWGMVAIAPPASTYNHHGFENIDVSQNYGAGFWGEHIAFFSLKNMAFGERNYMASIPVELSSSWWFTISRSSLLNTAPYNCTNNCGTTGYPYGLRLTALPTSRNPNNDSSGGEMSFVDDNSVIGGGIKVDTNGMPQKEGGLKVTNTTIEQPNNNAVTVDPRYAQAMAPFTLDNVYLQDNMMGYNPAYINFTDHTTPAAGSVDIRGLSTILTGTVAGKYYTGRILSDGTDYAQGFIQNPVGRTTPPGTITDGSITKTELDGIGASMGPSLIPFATQATTTNPALWSVAGCGGSPTLTTVLAPDGTMTAGEIDSGGGGTPCPVQVASLNTATAVGDRFLYGAWVRPGANQTSAGSMFGPFGLHSYGATDVFDSGYNSTVPNAYQMQVSGDWWHPMVALTTLTSATAGSHGINLSLYGGNNRGQGNQFWMPFMIYIPASAGVPLDEVERIRQELLHGVVPPGMPAGGGVLAMNPAHKLYWGSDTNLYRGAAGVVQTDGAFNANGTGGYQVNGAAPSGHYLRGNGTNYVDSAIQAADIPTLNQNTTGTAANVLSTTVLPNGVTATTQLGTDNSTKVATTAQVQAAISAASAGVGNVTGPSSSTSADLVSFNGTTGKTIQDSGIAASSVRTTAGGQTITAADTLSGLASGCTQFPCEVAKVAPTTYSGTSGVNPSVWLTPSAAGQFRMCGYVDVTVAGSAGYANLVLYYTSDGHAFSGIDITGATNSITTQWSVYQTCYNFFSDASQNIKWGLTMSSATGSPTIRYAVTLEQLQ
jgi:hypothetical protein